MSSKPKSNESTIDHIDFRDDKGILFVVSGPSGVGKTTIINRLLEIDEKIKYSISHTTREKRPDEINGKDYYFVPREEFKKIERNGGFIETARVFGEYYGTSREFVQEELFNKENDLIMDIDVQGADQIRESEIGAVFIFIFPPSKEKLRERFLARGSENSKQRKTRMELAEKELTQAKKFDYGVINDELNKAVKDFEAIMKAERLKIINGK